jgi:hypothetical protein
MSGGAVVAIVVTLFFIIGITVGIITVVALSTLRKERVGVRPPVSARFRRDAPADPAVPDDPEDDVDDQDAAVSGVPGHWDGSTNDSSTTGNTTEDPSPANNRHWWQDDTESNSPG